MTLRARAVAAESALWQLAPTCHPAVYLLDSGVSLGSRKRLERMFVRSARGRAIHWVPVERNRLDHLPAVPGFPPTVYARLLLAELLPATVRRTVYPDVDVLVRGDISPLFSIDLQGAPLGAAVDFAIPDTDHEFTGIEAAETRPYFNSGVLVIDMDQWRSQRMGERVIAYAAEHEAGLWPEQDAMNAVIDKPFLIDARWNCQLGALKHPELTYFRDTTAAADTLVTRLLRDAIVAHFAGPKPWNPLCTSPRTTAWVAELIRSRWYQPAEFLAWLYKWLRTRLTYGATARLGRLLRAVRGRLP
jgi:lipopolysaccharide biosynthesis glycosyltransferase